MEALLSLETYDPELREYLLQHRYPAILEALLTGLAVMVPRDPWEYVEEKLRSLKDYGRDCDIHWDSFVDPDIRSELQRMRRGMLDSILDETDLPTEEMFEKAYNFKTNRLLRWAFDGWLVYHEGERRELREHQQKMSYAKQHYITKMRKLIFHKWKSYSSHKKTCCLAAMVKMRVVSDAHMKRVLFQAWLEDYRETRRAKRWFKRERGGREDTSDGEEEWHWPEGEDPVSLLNRHITRKIFSQLGIQELCRCACVCRTWKEISEDPELWNRLDFFPICHFVRDSVLNRLIQKYRTLLVHLNLRGCNQLTNDSLRNIGLCQNLQDLNLSECQGVRDHVMEQIVKGCSGLLYLNLSFCYVTDSVIKILTKHCPSLHYLSLAYSPNFTSKGLHSITTGKGCRRLVYLDLSGCTELQLAADSLYYVGKGCPILNTLILDDIIECDDPMILKLVAHCHTLRHISLMGGSKVTDKALKYLAMENRKLKTIKIENNSMITDVSLRAIGKACRELTLLYIAGCSRVTDQGLKALGSLKKLQTLNIADCTRVSDAGVRYIVENAPGSQLRELNLTNCLKISDVSLLRMSQSCKSLTYLCFCYCEHISDTGVELLGHIPSLTSLDLSGCNLSDQGVAGLRNNPQFKHLTLAELLDITDDGLQKMCSTLSKLETLDLCDCQHITDSGVQAVAYNCRMLRTLLIAHCHKVSDDSARFVSQGCKYLSNLDMSGCNISDYALRHLKRHCTNLQTLDILCCVNVTREAVHRFQKTGVEINYNTDRPKFVTQNTIADMPVEPLVDRI